MGRNHPDLQIDSFFTRSISLLQLTPRVCKAPAFGTRRAASVRAVGFSRGLEMLGLVRGSCPPEGHEHQWRLAAEVGRAEVVRALERRGREELPPLAHHE